MWGALSPHPPRRQRASLPYQRRILPIERRRPADRLDHLGPHPPCEVVRGLLRRDLGALVELHLHELARDERLADRILKRYATARADLEDATAKKDGDAAEKAKQTMDALVLFKGDMEAFIRLYTFLSQIFDYGNTAVEKRGMFYKALVRLLDFGREWSGVDLSKVVLTHYHLKGGKSSQMLVRDGPRPTLPPMTAAGQGQGQVQDKEKEKERLSEIIARVNDLFSGDLTDEDRVAFVEHLRGKLLESPTLQAQAVQNSKAQFKASPDLTKEITMAVIGALDAYSTISSKTLNSDRVRQGVQDTLVDVVGLYEALRERGAAA